MQTRDLFACKIEQGAKSIMKFSWHIRITKATFTNNVPNLMWSHNQEGVILIFSQGIKLKLTF
jgi:hypothetical protein